MSVPDRRKMANMAETFRYFPGDTFTGDTLALAPQEFYEQNINDIYRLNPNVTVQDHMAQIAAKNAYDASLIERDLNK